MLNIFREFPNLINVIAIIIGWWIINRQNNQREIRKEIRALLNDIQKMISEIETEGISFHTEKYDLKKRSLLASRTRLMSKKIEIAGNTLGIDYSDHINAFRNSIMTDNWEKSGFQVLDIDDKLIKGIQFQASEISIKLERDFANCYHKKWHSVR